MIAPTAEHLAHLLAWSIQSRLTDAGFEIDHQWQPEKGKALFVVAKRLASQSLYPAVAAGRSNGPMR